MDAEIQYLFPIAKCKVFFKSLGHRSTPASDGTVTTNWINWRLHCEACGSTMGFAIDILRARSQNQRFDLAYYRKKEDGGYDEITRSFARFDQGFPPEFYCPRFQIML